MKSLNILFVILVAFNLVCCSKMILNSKGTYARELKIFDKEEQRVVFIGMTHVAKPTFFAEVKSQIDSLRSEGYVFFKEGVSYQLNTSLQKKDTLRRKFRQLMGMTIGNYTDPNNKSLPRFFSNGKYVMQTDSLISLNEFDQRVDLTYNELVEAHENKYSEITLTECDFNTGMYDEYKCKDGNAYKNSFYVVDILRTDHLFSIVKDSKEPKIAIVYGAGHFKWLYPDMLNAGYVYKNKKLSFK